MLNKAQVEATLRRLFNGGLITAMPRRTEDAEMLMALGAASLDPQESYSEAELNHQLGAWLEAFADGPHMDHVTFRRCLVDQSLLLRDAAGHTYSVNGTVIASILEADATEVRPVDIYHEVGRERTARKREHVS